MILCKKASKTLVFGAYLHIFKNFHANTNEKWNI